jgi:hypothetical protein
VVVEAWWREREEGLREEGFFRFLWNGREWLGYGLPDGRVRGVYCPVHCAERDGRAPGARGLEGTACLRGALPHSALAPSGISVLASVG